MQNQFAAVFGVAIAALILPTSAIPASQTPHWCGEHRPHDSIVEIGQFYYRCNDGNLEPQGCIDGKHQKVAIGETFRVTSYQMRCHKNADGYMSVEYHACIIEEKVVEPGGVIQNSHHWYTCEQSGHFVVQELAGCIHNGQRIKRKERLEHDGIVYECADTEKLPEMKAVACAEGGKQYSIGDTFEDGDYHYACTRQAGKPVKEMFGCMKNGNKLFSQQTYTVDDVVYRCDVKHSKAKLALVGCLDKENGEMRKLGCRWTAGQAPFRYTMSCEQSGPSTVAQTQLDCIYGKVGSNGADTGVVIQPGCYRMLDGLGVGCRNGTAGGAEFVTFEAGQTQIAQRHDLQVC